MREHERVTPPTRAPMSGGAPPDRPPATPLLPVGLAVAGRRCVVVGGGRVGTRKVNKLLEAGGSVQVVSPVISQELTRLAAAGRITVALRPYQPGDLREVAVVVAATPERVVNAAVAAEARLTGTLAMICDDPSGSDLVGVAVIRRGGLTVTISTDGRCPPLLQLAREELEHLLTPDYAALLELVAEERRAARQQGRDLPRARWRAAMMPQLLGLLRDGQLEAARRRLRSALWAASQR